MVKINERRKGRGRSLYVSFNGHYFLCHYFLCDYFYAVVLFLFLCCFIDEGAIKLGEGIDVMAPVHRGFLLFFIFLFFLFYQSFCYLCELFMRKCGAKGAFFAWHDYVSKSYAGDKSRAKRGNCHSEWCQEKHHSRHHHRQARTEKEGTQMQKKSDAQAGTHNKQTSNITGTILAVHSRQMDLADRCLGSYR